MTRDIQALEANPTMKLADRSAKRKAPEEAKRKAAEEAKMKAAEEARKVAEEAKRKAAEEARKAHPLYRVTQCLSPVTSAPIADLDTATATAALTAATPHVTQLHTQLDTLAVEAGTAWSGCRDLESQAQRTEQQRRNVREVVAQIAAEVADLEGRLAALRVRLADTTRQLQQLDGQHARETIAAGQQRAVCEGLDKAVESARQLVSDIRAMVEAAQSRVASAKEMDAGLELNVREVFICTRVVCFPVVADCLRLCVCDAGGSDRGVARRVPPPLHRPHGSAATRR